MPRPLIAANSARDAGIAIPLPAFHEWMKHATKVAMQNVLTPPRLERPKSLTIRFSRASDLDQVLDLYDGTRKRQIDPNGFIRPRSYSELAEPVTNGTAVLAFDENGEIRSAALATCHTDGDRGTRNFTEIGAVLCDVGGVGLSKLVVSMLALKQQFNPEASGRVFAKVAADNGPSNQVFSRALGWDSVCQETESSELYDIALRTHNGQGQRDRLWYAFGESANKKAVDILRSALGTQALHAKDGASIRLNANESSIWSTLQFNEMLARPCASA